ncbi:Hpt domain-containing protein [Pseudomonas huanghezhanensis]|uniref:Hpt domain-containing protein n=1 Tax=Pseudomonas huanghezhanensis TaxID=3002903 RepID=UPI002E1A8755
MGDEYTALVEVFLKDSDERIQALHQLLGIGEHSMGAQPADPDTTALGLMAHSFKGSSSNMGAVQLADLCLQLEVLARSTIPASRSALVELTQRVEREYQIVRRLFDLERQLLTVRD